jgi:hypothetical protein
MPHYDAESMHGLGNGQKAFLPNKAFSSQVKLAVCDSHAVQCLLVVCDVKLK